jgi:cation diffusion facilitator CzcD-associated flavoprotein CzcO
MQAGEGNGAQRQNDEAVRYDAIVIGAGIAGMCQLYRLRQLGLSVRVFETGTDVGGTWYWNRYPGARFDSESYTYGYAFSDELLQEWNWKEHFESQPETLKYLQHVADRFDLKRDIQFQSCVVAARWNEAEVCWDVTLESGERARGTFLITCLGPLSAHTLPRIDGIETFQGEGYHTARWPKQPVDFKGKRVGIIGTGATGIQTITEVAKTVGHLTVFQRTPNYAAPLRNRPITDEEMRDIKARYPEIFARCRQTPGCFIHMADPRGTFEVTDEEREAHYEKLYAEPGFGIWQGNFRDMLTDPAANELATAFIKKKIRARLKDPKIAEKLIPTNHGFGTRRVPLESGYYEVYNQDNVTLVDLLETPIERITPKGIKTTAAEYEFDMLIYATGFDAVTGGFDRIDIRGRDGVCLKAKWAEGPKTYLGLQSAGFPNLLTIVGPHNAAARCNIPRCIEQNVDWVSDLMRHMRDAKLTRIEALPEAEHEWTEAINVLASGLLYTQVNSWMTGINSNVEGKNIRRVLQYQGGAPAYRERCDEVAAAGYKGFALS